MTILVVGAGATGGYLGARLAQAGRDVTFLVRPHRADQLRDRGLRITGPGAKADHADLTVQPNLVMAGDLTRPADIVILSVKATALEHAIADFAPAVGPQTAIVPFLNGMAHMDVLNGRFGEQTVLGGVGVFLALAAQTAMDQIFRVFVYRSAVGMDTSGGPFAQSDLQTPFVGRNSRRRSF